MNHIDLWVDCQQRRLVNAAGSYASEAPVFVRGDQVLLRIRFVDVDRSASPFTVTQRVFNSGAQFYLTAKASFTGSMLVFSEHSVAWNMNGDWSGVDVAKGCCSCRVDLNGSELLSAVGTESEALIWFDIDVIDSDGSVTTLWRLRLPIWNDVHRGNEGDPAPAAPTYPTTEQFDYRHDPAIRLVKEDGGVRLYVDGVPGALLR